MPEGEEVFECRVWTVCTYFYDKTSSASDRTSLSFLPSKSLSCFWKPSLGQAMSRAPRTARRASRAFKLVTVIIYATAIVTLRDAPAKLFQMKDAKWMIHKHQCWNSFELTNSQWFIDQTSTKQYMCVCDTVQVSSYIQYIIDFIPVHKYVSSIDACCVDEIVGLREELWEILWRWVGRLKAQILKVCIIVRNNATSSGGTSTCVARQLQRKLRRNTSELLDNAILTFVISLKND